MDFQFSEEQKIFRDAVEKFARNEIAPTAAAREEAGEFSFEMWKKLCGYGLAGLSIPVEYGGGGADAMTTVLAMITFSAACRDLSMAGAWGTHLLLAAMPIAEIGTDEQKKKYLPVMASGEWIGALGLTEPEAGTDATSLRTRAVRKGDEYVLNGSKTFISNAPIADVFIVVASVDLSERAGGLTLFIVDRSCPGVTTGRPLKKRDGDSWPTGEVFFDDCRVPAANRLGEEKTGFTHMLTSLGWERIAFAPFVGLMESDLNLCIEYAKQRVQFGKPIAKFQLVQAMLAEMKMDLEASRWLAYHLAWKKDRGEFIGLDAAIAKTFITEAAERSAGKAVQIFGGYGCMREYPIGQSLWATKLGVIGGGTSQIQRTIIGRMLTGM
ncbi:MAG: acyl-CoA dehydrogenase family protein [Proteobacteria bacterium]|nr:acyl-CoA dehydrogenase family protein [Pseudomonadota bacterium]